MRKIALLLCLCLCLSACGGGAKPLAGGAPAERGAERVIPTPTPTPEPSEAPEVWDPGPGDAQLRAGEDYDFTQPVPETAAVDPSYFADAVFVGDSRTEGFRLYSGLTKGDFLAHTGLMIFRIYKTEITVNGEKMTVLEALEKKQYKKVYISLGVNELGMYNDKGYHDNYVRFIGDVRRLQPDATIILQLNIPVNTQKCKEKKQPSYVTNEQITVFNDILRQVAQEEKVFLVDPGEAIVDEMGEASYDLTADGVHFKKDGYVRWYEYLRSHTVERGDWT